MPKVLWLNDSTIQRFNTFLALSALTRVKRLEKIVPEQIEPAAFDQILPGKAHDLTHLLSIFRLVTVYGAMFADGFVVERAAQSALKSIKKKFAAFFTDRKFLQRQVLQSGLISRKG
jgi:hypothetical protein